MQQPLAVIVGSGLAGSSLAWALHARGWRLCLADDGAAFGASRAAAGLLNPITGRKFGLGWRVAEQLETWQQWARRWPWIEQHLHLQDLYRPFATVFEYNEWQRRSLNPGLDVYSQLLEEAQEPAQLYNPLGGLIIKGGGWLDVPALLNAIHALLPGRRLNHLAYHDVDPENSTLRLPDEVLRYDALIWAQGIAAAHNPWWQGPPIIPLKGELLELNIRGLELPLPLAGPHYLIDRGGGRFLLGATYEPNVEDLTVPSPACQSLHEYMAQRMPGLRYEVSGYRVGIRPTTYDRRPYMGAHTTFGNMYFLNGLGTKGVMASPWLAEQLAHWLEGGPAPPADLDWGRRPLAKKSAALDTGHTA